MIRSILLKVYYLIALIVVLINSFFLLKSDLFFDIEDLPKGEYMYSVTSPDNFLKLDIFRVRNSVGSAIRVSATDNSKGDTRNIYWQTGIESVNLTWRGNGEIVIDEMPINIVQGGFYDCRRGLSIMLAGSLYSEGEKK